FAMTSCSIRFPWFARWAMLGTGLLTVAALLPAEGAAPRDDKAPELPPRDAAAITNGLMWLALHQSADGSWSLNEFNLNARDKPQPAGKVFRCNCSGGATAPDNVAATSFALLPFLAA